MSGVLRLPHNSKIDNMNEEMKTSKQAESLFEKHWVKSTGKPLDEMTKQHMQYAIEALNITAVMPSLLSGKLILDACCGGILIFKWNEHDIRLSEILKLTPHRPLFGHPSGKAQKTHWVCFMKSVSGNGA